MVYVTSDGRVHHNQPFSVKYIVDSFWALVSMIILFFRSLLHFDDSSSTRGQYGNSRGNAPTFPRRRMGGFRSGGGPAPPPCMPGAG